MVDVILKYTLSVIHANNAQIKYDVESSLKYLRKKSFMIGHRVEI